MKAVISRSYSKFATRGSLFVLDGHDLLFRCKSIELPMNGNQKNVSCIPEGVYDCIKHYSPTKGPCFWVKDVPDRGEILIHTGNYVMGKKIDSRGCILPGIYFSDLNEDGFIDIADSKKAMDVLLRILPEKFSLYII